MLLKQEEPQGVPLISDATIVSNPGQTYNPVNGPLPDYGAPGDSGSPLFAYDEQQKKWVIVAVLRAYAGINGATNWWNVIPTDYLNQVMQDDFDAPVDFVSGLPPELDIRQNIRHRHPEPGQ